MYSVIRTTAYEPDPEHGPWTETAHVLDLGNALEDALTGLRPRPHGREARRRELPVRRLNSLLRAMAPGVIATAREGVGSRASRLYAREPVPEKIVTPIVGTWAADLLPGHDDVQEGGKDRIEAEDERVRDLEHALTNLPGWHTETVDLTETRRAPGGTAEPAHRLYQLLPEWLAFRLAARPYVSRGEQLRFRVASCAQGAELVSWPPRRFEYRKQTWYYSALVTVNVHTVPFAERFRVHVSTSIRRWATRFEARHREFCGATVLLDVPFPWPDGPDRGYRLSGNSLFHDRKRGHVAWRRHSPALLLPDLDIVRGYPAPEDLLASPETWIEGRDDIAAGIVHSPPHGPHGVGPGLMPKERAALDAWVEAGLKPLLRRVPDLQRVTRRNAPSLLPRSVSGSEKDSRHARQALARRAALAAALDGRPLDVEIFWQSSETREELLAALPGLLGLTPGRKAADSMGEVSCWRTDGLDIRVRTRRAGALAARLEISGDRARPRAERFADAVDDRCALAACSLTRPEEGHGLALVEIAGKERFKSAADTDPKHALRIACARQGRLSQFVNSPEDASGPLAHRARSAWLDAFRQLGAVRPPAHRVGEAIPSDLQYAALWLVRYTRKGPTRRAVRRLVAVRVRPEGGERGEGAVHGWDEELAAWVPYPQFLLSLAEDAAATDTDDEGRSHDHNSHTVRTGRLEPGASSQWQREVERQIKTLLYQLRDRPTLLLADAGNLRQAWPWLRNGSLVRDCLGFSTTPTQRVGVYGQDLRVVLTRDSNSRAEVPEWYAHDDRGKTGFAKGVWGPPDADNRVFASTADVPHTATLPKGLMKLVPTAANPGATHKTAWNPALLELTVLGCVSGDTPAAAPQGDTAPDRPAEWATLAHQLRFHDDYSPLARPLPLHLARLVGQYVLPLVDAPLACTDEPAAPGQPG